MRRPESPTGAAADAAAADAAAAGNAAGAAAGLGAGLRGLGAVGAAAAALGRVLAMHVQDDGVLNAEKYYIDTPKLNLVGRMHGRGWYARTNDRVDIPRKTYAQWKAEEKK